MYLLIQIRLLFCRLLFGRSSLKFEELLKKSILIKNKKPKLTFCFNNEVILHFEHMILKKKAFPVFGTRESIGLDAIEFGEELGKITKRKGEPQCINTQELGKNIIHIIGYRETIMDKSVKTLFFTCKNKYFFGEYLFQSGLKEIQEPLANIILQKYKIPFQEPPASFYIEDVNGSLLCFYDDGFSLFIKYYNPGFSPIHDELSILFKVQSTAPPETDPDTLSNRLKILYQKKPF